ncbi:hypothetical protein ACE6H2_014740 [Prunus campanulata]
MCSHSPLVPSAVSFPSSLAQVLGGLHATIGNNNTIESGSGCRRQIQVPNREASQSATWGTTVCTISDPPLIQRHVDQGNSPKHPRPRTIGIGYRWHYLKATNKLLQSHLVCNRYPLPILQNQPRSTRPKYLRTRVNLLGHFHESHIESEY